MLTLYVKLKKCIESFVLELELKLMQKGIRVRSVFAFKWHDYFLFF